MPEEFADEELEADADVCSESDDEEQAGVSEELD